MPSQTRVESAGTGRTARGSRPERGRETPGHSVGNRAMGSLLRLGASADPAEGRAHATSDAVMRRLAGHGGAPPSITRRASMSAPPPASEVLGAQQSAGLTAATRGGRPLTGSARGELERGFGRSLSAMRIHDDPQAHALTRSFGARALSVDNHLFFGARQYDPASRYGKQVLSHEIAHALEAEPGVVRRLHHDATLNAYYSDPLSGQKVDATNGVATVTGSSSSWFGGHAFLYLEYLDRDTTTNVDTPHTRRVELTAGGVTTSGTRSGSGSGSESGHSTAELSGVSTGYSTGSSGSDSGSAERLHIKIDEASSDDISHLKKARLRKSWVVGRTAIDGMLNKATDIKNNVAQYTYKLLGRSLFARKKTINCVRFVEKILKAGGVAASAGKVFKLASTLASGPDVDYVKDTAWEALELQRAQQRQLQEQQAALALQQRLQQAALVQQANDQRLSQLGITEDRKHTITWDPAVATLQATSDNNTDSPLAQYTLVDGEPTAPGEIKRGSILFAKVLTAKNRARLVSPVVLTDGDRRNQVEADLSTVLAAITAAT